MVGQTLLGGRKKKGKKGRQRSPKYALYEYLASYNKQIKEYNSRKMSSTPFFSEAQGLDAAIECLNSWTPNKINITVATSLEDETPVQLNLMSTLGTSSYGRLCASRHWLPKEFNSNSGDYRSNVIAPLFILACKDAGFAVKMKGWEKKSKLIKFACARDRPYRKNTVSHITHQADSSYSSSYLYSIPYSCQGPKLNNNNKSIPYTVWILVLLRRNNFNIMFN